MRGGIVVGATDKQAGEVVERPITPQDMCATVLDRLGIDYTKVLHTPLGRPVPLVDDGHPVRESFSGLINVWQNDHALSQSYHRLRSGTRSTSGNHCLGTARSLQGA